ncbi:MAG: 1,2-phenylacetyl-CoA epoxidase subunit PaaD [Jatrophihabitans sp.]
MVSNARGATDPVQDLATRTNEAEPAGGPWAAAAATPDPELPMLTVADLGILRAVEQKPGGGVVATITPTYSGCPAMREISLDVRQRLQRAGYRDVEIRTQLAPAWTSDWITADGRRKLAAAAIAAPHAVATKGATIPLQLGTTRRLVQCPHCGSQRTERTADFSATACKALHRCTECREPFEYVKDI